jgi:hypothetical protein
MILSMPNITIHPARGVSGLKRQEHLRTGDEERYTHR